MADEKLVAELAQHRYDRVARTDSEWHPWGGLDDWEREPWLNDARDDLAWLAERSLVPDAADFRALFNEAFDVSRVGYTEPTDDLRDELWQALSARGVVVPGGAEVSEQWEAWCHAGDSDGIVLSSRYAEVSRERAEEWAREQIGKYGITRYTLARREYRRWPDGTQLTTPWVAVPEEPA